MDREGKKYPQHSSVFVPTVEPDGSIERGKNKRIILEEEFGGLTCWHIVHRDGWKNDLSAKSCIGRDNNASGIGREQVYGYEYKEQQE